jgi:hypothetical protein
MRRALLTTLVAACATTLVAACAVSPLTVAATAPSPKRVVAQAKTEWLGNLRDAARNGDVDARFPSPSRTILLRRLRLAQREFYKLFDRAAIATRCSVVCPPGFKIVSVRMLHPLQSAPVLVIRSDRKGEIARATAGIVALIDPHHPRSANPSGYAYEGYFLVVEDFRGVPYLATFNYQRAPHIGGGEWAASAGLYRFPHG